MNDRLYRSRDDRMLAGVAGGLAEYWDADPSLIRIIWALLVLVTGGVALVIYIVMAFVVPDEDALTYAMPATPPTPPTPSTPGAVPPDQAPAAGPTGWIPPTPPAPPSPYMADRLAARRAAREARRAYRRQYRGSGVGVIFFGVLLVLMGVFFLAREWLPALSFDWFWPLVLIALGLLVLAAAFGWTRDDRGAAR
jgi:phage shock protein PspC (stress-responsive transcriptional regulator)